MYLRNLKNFAPDPNEFPDFDDNLRQSLLTETEMFFGSIVNEDRNVLDLLNANYTFVNERLAQHYGIPECLWAAIPPRDADRRSAPRVARAGKRSDGDFVCHAHLAGAARQMDSDQRPRNAAARAAAQRSGAEGK